MRMAPSLPYRARAARAARPTLLAVTAITAALAAGAGPARAAGPEANADPSQPFVLRKDSAWVQAATMGRARMKQGDCRSAVDAFDEALRASVDVTVVRDRGLCHEQLGHPYPAIDDYRAYLTVRGNASDAEDIRARLARLEEQVGVGGRSPGASGGKDAPPAQGAPASGGASASLSPSGASFDTSGSAGAGGGKGDERPPANASLDAIQGYERDAMMADGSSLRRGKGFVVGPYLGIRRWGRSEFGWGQTYGITFRYSMGRVGTVLSEIGYSSVNADGTASSRGGFAGLLGFELRFALDRLVTNALFVGAGLSYEHLKQPSTGIIAAVILPRGRLGYRHVFGQNLGLELGADGGLAFVNVLDAPPYLESSFTSPTIQGTAALVLAF